MIFVYSQAIISKFWVYDFAHRAGIEPAHQDLESRSPALDMTVQIKNSGVGQRDSKEFCSTDKAIVISVANTGMMLFTVCCILSAPYF